MESGFEHTGQLEPTYDESSRRLLELWVSGAPMTAEEEQAFFQIYPELADTVDLGETDAS